MKRLASSILGALTLAGVTMLAAPCAAQTPQPFPRPPAQPSPTEPQEPQQPPPQTSPAPPAPAPVQMPPVQTPPAQAAGPSDAPTEATLGVPIYPNAQFIGSYDAGRGQRFYLFGVAATYADMVSYYRATLKDRGEELFETPGTHMFEVGRYRDESMAFPPSVTVKDYTWGGSPGLPNPKAGAEPSHFPTVLQIVPAPGR